jgi:hypothetical protein
MEITDLEMLVLADIVYERFKEEDKKKDLTQILDSKREFQNPLRKARWEAVSEKMKDWKLIDAFDLGTFGEIKGLSKEEIENTTEYQQFYAAAFQKGNGEIVIA